jgi:hypothetical protein
MGGLIRQGLLTFIFCPPTDAQRILQIGQLTISGTSVSLHPEETVQQPRGQPRGHKQMFKTNHSSSLQSTFPTGRVPTADELSGVNTIQIVDIPRISQQHLRLELENVCRGKVLDVTIYQEDRTAVIKFKLQIGMFYTIKSWTKDMRLCTFLFLLYNCCRIPFLFGTNVGSSERKTGTKFGQN